MAQRLAHGLHQQFAVDRLGEKVAGAGLEGAGALRHVAVAGDEDDGQGHAGAFEFGLQFQAGGARHADVQHQAGDLIGDERGQKLQRGREGHHFQAGAADQQADRIQHGRIVVNHIHNRVKVGRWRHETKVPFHTVQPSLAARFAAAG